MVRLRHPILTLLLVASLTVAVSTAPAAASAPESATASAVAAPLLPVVGPLSHAKIPVYLPGWLPHFGRRLYASSALFEQRTMYQVYLTTTRSPLAHSFIAFWMIGAVEPAQARGRRVTLSNGRTGYVNLNKHQGQIGPTLSWTVGRVGYTIGGMRTVSELIRVARSVKRVH